MRNEVKTFKVVAQLVSQVSKLSNVGLSIYQHDDGKVQLAIYAANGSFVWPTHKLTPRECATAMEFVIKMHEVELEAPNTMGEDALAEAWRKESRTIALYEIRTQSGLADCLAAVLVELEKEPSYDKVARYLKHQTISYLHVFATKGKWWGATERNIRYFIAAFPRYSEKYLLGRLS